MNLSMLEIFYIFPTSLFRKVLPYALQFPLCFFKAHCFEKLRENFIKFHRAVATERKRKING